MLTTYLRDTSQGRLQRLPYLGYSLLLQLALVLFIMAIVFALGLGEHVVGGDLAQAQSLLQEKFSTPLLLVCLLVGLLFTFANLNITAKRIRDTGLPGWRGVAVIAVASVVLAMVLPQVASGFQTLCWVALLVIPSDVFSGQKRS